MPVLSNQVRWGAGNLWVDNPMDEELRKLLDQEDQAEASLIPWKVVSDLELRGDGPSLLRRGKYAAAETLLTDHLKDLKDRVKRLKAEGQESVYRECEQSLSTQYSDLPEVDKEAIVRGLLSETIGKLHMEIAETRWNLTKIEKGLKQWGDEKPISARYDEIWKREWRRRLRSLRILSIIICTSAFALWSFSLSMWWILIPVVVSLFFILLGIVTQHTEYGKLYEVWDDPELREYSKKHPWRW